MVQELIITHAREWIGTPYCHQASLKHKGSDCVGLLIGIWREVYGSIPSDFILPTYTPAWAEETKESQLVEISRIYLQEIDICDFIPGDVIMYRMSREAPTKHCAIVTSPTSIVHAYQGHGVIETPLLCGRNIQLTHAFKFPEIK